MLKEACVENFTFVPQAIKAGANRIELNNDLAAGGTTPSFGVIEKTAAYAHKHAIPVVVMIRPRGGNFIYEDDELAIMKSDLRIAGQLGVDAVALGCLTSANLLNQKQMLQLLGLAKSLHIEVVMHMAFDKIPNANQHAVLDWLAQNGVKRILTHGGSLEKTLEANLAHLQEIIAWAGTKIEILPGGGINAINRDEIAQKLGVQQLHGSRIVAFK